MKSIIQKYNIPGPRYTSYPTVPYWSEDSINKAQWLDSVAMSFSESNEDEGISLYIHLPFCESLCTFCGCHKRITKRHIVESPYIEAVLKEWDLYLEVFQGTPRLKEIHLGGGTPTFFSPDNLEKLISGILEKAEKTDNYEFSFEAHPNNTTEAHLRKLYELGFRRNSFGVQDYDPLIQKTINRIQSFEQVKEVTDKSREVGYNSISHDLVFGLPHQTLDSIKDSIEKTSELLPERIAFYSYAHVPWIKGLGQRGYSDADLPKDEVKRELYEYGKKRFLELGYEEIGMDHFALKTDGLYKAVENKTLHRNFMGYTSGKTQLMIGLGMSSISDSWYNFAQNVKTVEGYEQQIANGEIPIFRGHVLSDEDLVIRKHILNIMCHLRTDFSDPAMQFPELGDTLSRLKEMEDDGLIEIGSDYLQVHEVGRPFIRNICMAFDLHLIRKAPQTRVFSMTI
ncbi:MAG: oxygen-independent coproporphyrinogen III oxidase [Crocinitomicaceae bacterium]|nr:oxygen-independent coproporphyrinogen III oxidase [Crocinitomicaceae bacterium]